MNIVRFIAALFFVLHPAAWANGGDLCDLPESLQRQVTHKYSGFKVITTNLLRKDDQSLFRTDHGGACPGMVELDFYGSGKPTSALALTKRINKQSNVKLIIATQRDIANKWDLIELDSANVSAAPVIWKEPSGEYRDIKEEKAIKAKYPVILFVQYEAWGILYAWVDDSVKKIWVSD